VTLTPGKRRLYTIRQIAWLTDIERMEIEEFHKQFGGDFVVTESDSPMKGH
jgi:hypothetical protein